MRSAYKETLQSCRINNRSKATHYLRNLQIFCIRITYNILCITYSISEVHKKMIFVSKMILFYIAILGIFSCLCSLNKNQEGTSTSLALR